MRKPFLAPKVHFQRSFFTNQKCFIVTGDKLGYLTAFLNSTVFRFAFKEYFPELLGDTRELSKVFFETVSIKQVGDVIENKFVGLVNKVQELKQKGVNTHDLEIQIEKSIAELYGLSDDEIEIIENEVAL